MINEYLIEIRRFIERNESKAQYGANAFFYEVRDDEVFDPSLVSLRAYGSRVYTDIIVLASGNSFLHEPLKQKIISLPSLDVILKLQKKYGVTY